MSGSSSRFITTHDWVVFKGVFKEAHFCERDRKDHLGHDRKFSGSRPKCFGATIFFVPEVRTNPRVPNGVKTCFFCTQNTSAAGTSYAGLPYVLPAIINDASEEQCDKNTVPVLRPRTAIEFVPGLRVYAKIVLCQNMGRHFPTVSEE